jgi:DNA-3-methyladenine glycosylase
MQERRRTGNARLLAAGPGRLCEALGVSREHDGLALDRPPFELLARAEEPVIVAAPRVGITHAADNPWRYVLAGSRFLSRAVPRG